jgi:hypothetical protein
MQPNMPGMPLGMPGMPVQTQMGMPQPQMGMPQPMQMQPQMAVPQNDPHAWEMKLNLAGLAPVSPNRVNLPTGPYHVAIDEVVTHLGKKGTTSLAFNCHVTDPGEYNGAQVSIYLGTDLSKDMVRRNWLTAGLSAGYNAQQLQNGEITLKEGNFKGRAAFIKVTAKNSDDPKAYDDRAFVTPEDFAREVQLATQQKTTPQVPQQVPQMVAQPVQQMSLPGMQAVPQMIQQQPMQQQMVGAAPQPMTGGLGGLA